MTASTITKGSFHTYRLSTWDRECVGVGAVFYVAR
uniref:Uncharacterized protein n=1 Tax=Arundo donax TaxID=35708 RepID=A0A0A9AK93_ARUDO